MNSPLENFTIMSIAHHKGLQVIYDPYLNIKKKAKRPLKERLFSLPWRPFKVWNNYLVPSPDLYLVNNKIIGHPLTISTLVKEVEAATRSSTA